MVLSQLAEPSRAGKRVEGITSGSSAWDENTLRAQEKNTRGCAKGAVWSRDGKPHPVHVPEGLRGLQLGQERCRNKRQLLCGFNMEEPCIAACKKNAWTLASPLHYGELCGPQSLHSDQDPGQGAPALDLSVPRPISHCL